ncbi:TPA: NADP-dependent oxidoreductase [Candidatus Latescibacteria bacterium]|nr:NADP-dependent oxidoreductase [Candidatus Latescibacterota bacterium]|tara:strand:- start:1364 stop:2371 length:1008 start_codon:yes stop_codon:yes gene_type:complete
MPEKNRQITLAQRPYGFPKESDFKLVETDVPKPNTGEMLIRNEYMSVDPYMRGRMNEGASYSKGVDIGEVMVGGTVGQVIESNHPDYQSGDMVQANLGWQTHGISNGEGARKVDPSLAPISMSLGVLGMPGLTAYFGLLDVAQPVAGETVVVSAASGAVGSVVGQIAKIKGCRTVGCAGTDEKVRYVLDDLGFDGAFNYKTSNEHGASFQELCPDGIDVYFDNVGGPITDAVFPLLNLRARVAVCGQIAQYNATEPPVGPRLLWHCIVKRLRIQGLLVFDWADQYDQALREMAQWVSSGQITYREDIVDGIENAPEAFMGLLRGDHIGKRLVKIA